MDVLGLTGVTLILIPHNAQQMFYTCVFTETKQIGFDLQVGIY